MFGNSKTLVDAITKVIDTKYYKHKILAQKCCLLAEGAYQYCLGHLVMQTARLGAQEISCHKVHI